MELGVVGDNTGQRRETGQRRLRRIDSGNTNTGRKSLYSFIVFII
jgi:hypothetical protein